MIAEYLNELKAKKYTENAIKNNRVVLKKLEQFKPIEQITRKDLVEYFNSLNYADSTFVLHQSAIKRFFKHIGKPDLVEWIQPKKVKETLKSDDILTPEEINSMIDATESYYWKALIAFLFETGARISEASIIKYKDIQDTESGMIVNIPTNKTAAGYRKVILPFSSQYIRNLKTYTAGNKENIIFKLSYTQTFVMLNEIAKNAGITKPVSPHKFRHAQATDMVRRSYNEAIIRKKLGWTATSPMIARYQHLNDEDVINATLENTGKLPQTASPRTPIKEADKITLVEASMQFSKLTEDLEVTKEKNAKLTEKIELMMELMDKQQITLEELKDEVDAKKIYDQSPQRRREKEMIEEIRALQEKT